MSILKNKIKIVYSWRSEVSFQSLRGGFTTAFHEGQIARNKDGHMGLI